MEGVQLDHVYHDAVAPGRLIELEVALTLVASSWYEYPINHK